MKRLFYLVPLLILLQSACRPYHASITPIAAVTSTPASIQSSPTSSPTLAPEPSATLTPRPTPGPTLEPAQAEETIRALLSEPVDCAAPCFWGIEPGETTVDEARNIFTRLGLQAKSITYQGKDFYGIRHDFDDGLSIIVTLTVQDEIVTDLRVDIIPETQRARVPRDWSAYSPETLIKRYGPPSGVDFVLDWGPSPYFQMDIYFDAVDLIVEYAGEDIIPRQKGSPQVCPTSAQFEIVRLWMGEDPVNPPGPGGVPLEQATSMDMQEFSKLMTGNPEEACFQVKGEAFP